jgi:hypothetical protein
MIVASYHVRLGPLDSVIAVVVAFTTLDSKWAQKVRWVPNRTKGGQPGGLKLKTWKRCNRSGALRVGLLAGHAFGHDGIAKPSTEIVGQGIQLGIAVNFDGFFGRVADHVAVVTPSQVIFQVRLGAIVNRAIEVVG